MKGDIHGEVYKKIENFVSEQRQSPFSLSDTFKNQIRSVASKIRKKYQQNHQSEQKFLEDEALWLEVCDNY